MGPRFVTALVVVLMCTVAPGCAGEPSPEDEALEGSYDFSFDEAMTVLQSPDPFEDRLEQIVGVEVDSVRREFFSRRADAIAACAKGRGVVLPDVVIKNQMPPIGYEDNTLYGGSVENILGGTEVYSFATDPTNQRVLAECQEAGNTIDDPLAEFSAFVDATQRDLLSRGESSPAVVTAKDEEVQCFENLGVDPRQATADLTNVTSDAYSVNGRWLDGEISLADRDRQLESLLTKERATAEVLDQCTAPRLAVEAAIVNRFAELYLEQNRAALNDLGSETRRKLEAEGYAISS